MWQKLRKCYPPELELLSLLLLIFTFYLALSSYPTLPETIPTHFDQQGIPDGWGQRSFILIFPGIGAFLYTLLTSLNILLAQTEKPLRFINMPQRWKEKLTEVQIEGLRIFLNRSLFGLKLLMLGLFSYTTHTTLEIARGRSRSLGDIRSILLGGILILSGFMVWKVFRISHTPSPPP